MPTVLVQKLDDSPYLSGVRGGRLRRIGRSRGQAA
jgi:hypothetical protein